MKKVLFLCFLLGCLTAHAQKLAEYRQLMAAAVEHHKAELETKRKLSVTAGKLRDARRRLESKPTRPAR